MQRSIIRSRPRQRGEASIDLSQRETRISGFGYVSIVHRRNWLMKIVGALRPTLLAGVAAFLAMTAPVIAQNTRGSATGPTTAKGYDHPDQFIHLKPVKPADNMYPVIAHPEQEQQGRGKLAELERKTGKKPNFLVFLLDDVGWMDPGFNGGGIAVGNETPTMDKLANEGLNLTSAYSTPSCSPSRATIHTGQNPLHHGILRPPNMASRAGWTAQ
jgi:hypothetical protein